MPEPRKFKTLIVDVGIDANASDPDALLYTRVLLQGIGYVHADSDPDVKKIAKAVLTLALDTIVALS